MEPPAQIDDPSDLEIIRRFPEHFLGGDSSEQYITLVKGTKDDFKSFPEFWKTAHLLMDAGSIAEISEAEFLKKFGELNSCLNKPFSFDQAGLIQCFELLNVEGISVVLMCENGDSFMTFHWYSTA